MKKLHSLAFYALVTPAITLGAGTALAQQTSGPSVDSQQPSSQGTQRGNQQGGQQGNQQSGQQGSQQGNQQSGQQNQRDGGMNSQRRAGQADSSTAAADRRDVNESSRGNNRGFMDTTPEKGNQASNLIGADVKTSDSEKVGPVDDLIIDEDGQIVAIIVGVGGFLGMGTKDVAIGWDNVTVLGESDDAELRIDLSREELRDAQEYNTRN